MTLKNLHFNYIAMITLKETEAVILDYKKRLIYLSQIKGSNNRITALHGLIQYWEKKRSLLVLNKSNGINC